jgi:hypothetical protein
MKRPIDQGIEVDPSDTEKFSRSLMALSFNDRSAIEEEIHGVKCMACDETPEMQEDFLSKFDAELAQTEKKPAYDRAQELLQSNSATHPTCYLASREFKLRFLRSELFDVPKSVSKFVRCFDFLLEHFGEYALERPIRLSDFNKQEISFLREGQYQLLPYRDRSGRRIYCISANNRNPVPSEVLLKCIFYLGYVLCGGSDTSNNDLNNVETQRKGVVVVIMPSHMHLEYGVNENFLQKVEFVRNRAAMHKIVAEAMPMRVAASHLCFPKNTLTKIIASFGSESVAYHLRTKVHLGTPVELRYQLQQFGIPVDLIPSTDTGNIKNVNWKQWLQLRKYIEREFMMRGSIPDPSGSDAASHSSNGESMPEVNIVECPLTNDVIFRRGRSMSYHPGNAAFQNLIEAHIYEHTIDPNTTKDRKLAIEMELVETVRKQGGRFLKWEIDKSWWVEIGKSADSQKEIITKVRCAFRDFRKKMLKAQQEQISNSSWTYTFERQDGQRRKRLNNGKHVEERCGLEALYCGGDDKEICGFFFSTQDGSRLNVNGEPGRRKP